MRILFILIVTCTSYFSFSQSRKNIELLDNWQNPSLLSNSSNVKYNDCWGYTANGSEYAIAGSTEGTHYFKITEEKKFDEVDFIKRGWINRNNLLINNKSSLFSIPCLKISSNKKINEVKIHNDINWKEDFLKKIDHTYKRAPEYENVLPIIKKVCQISHVIGADVNELAPIKNFDSYNFLVAKLAYKILSYTFEFKR